MVAKVICMLAAVMGVAWGVRLIMGKDSTHFAWWWQVLLATVAVLSSVLVLTRQWQQYLQPMRRLTALLPQIRSGELPIEELARVTGSPAMLAPILQELFVELRQQRTEIGKLNDEMRDRVARRTDQLERRLGSVQLQANQDKLTGLYNRRALDEFLPSIVERCRLEIKPLAVMMVDVDNFKKLNDTKGHPAGDDFLRSAGQLIRSSIRPGDLAFRCGGDEIVVLLPDCPRAGAEALLKRIGDLGDALGKSSGSIPPPRLSIGLATLYDVLDPSAKTLLAEADKRLYEVKSSRKQGRAA